MKFHNIGDFVFLNGHGIKRDDIVSLKPDASGNTNVRTRDGVIALFSGVTPEEVARVIDGEEKKEPNFDDDSIMNPVNPSEIPAVGPFRKSIGLLDYSVHENARLKYKNWPGSCLAFLVKHGLSFWESVEYMRLHFKGLEE